MEEESSSGRRPATYLAAKLLLHGIEALVSVVLLGLAGLVGCGHDGIAWVEVMWILSGMDCRMVSGESGLDGEGQFVYVGIGESTLHHCGLQNLAGIPAMWRGGCFFDRPLT